MTREAMREGNAGEYLECVAIASIVLLINPPQSRASAPLNDVANMSQRSVTD